MKKFFNWFINLFINLFIVGIILLLFCFAVIYFFSKTNNIAMEDTISYVKEFDNKILSLDVIDTQSPNIQLADVNDTIEIINNNNKFYYNQLDYNEKIIYTALENNIDNLKKENFTIGFSTKFNNLLNQTDGQYALNRSFQNALDAFSYDHPELFYIDISKISLIIKYSTLGTKTTYTVSLAPQNSGNYLLDSFTSEEDVNIAIAKIESIKKQVLSNISNNISDYNKALKVHDILVNSLKYNSTYNKSNSHNIYGALVEKEVVCDGYAKAFKYILDSLNIECILVSGNATSSSGKTESHMWNYINLDNNWYGVDVTWDDPIIVGNINSKIIRHSYFCKGSNVFNESHKIKNKISSEGKAFSIPTLSYSNYK